LKRPDWEPQLARAAQRARGLVGLESQVREPARRASAAQVRVLVLVQVPAQALVQVPE
jgi:hypothetical protein